MQHLSPYETFFRDEQATYRSVSSRTTRDRAFLGFIKAFLLVEEVINKLDGTYQATEALSVHLTNMFRERFSNLMYLLYFVYCITL